MVELPQMSEEPCYEIRVWDNLHYMDVDETYTLRGFRTAEEALTKCKAIVDDYLENCTKQQLTAEAIYQGYAMFGEDPVIIALNGAPSIQFSGWDYAKARAQHFARI